VRGWSALQGANQVTPSHLIQCMKDYGTLSGKSFHSKYPDIAGRQLEIARRHNAHEWEVGSRVFVEIAKEMGE
jgi:hypothetical protein